MILNEKKEKRKQRNITENFLLTISTAETISKLRKRFPGSTPNHCLFIKTGRKLKQMDADKFVVVIVFFRPNYFAQKNGIIQRVGQSFSDTNISRTSQEKIVWNQFKENVWVRLICES